VACSVCESGKSPAGYSISTRGHQQLQGRKVPCTNKGGPHARTGNGRRAAICCGSFEGFAMQLHHNYLVWALGAFSRVPSDPGSAIVLNSPHASRICQNVDRTRRKQLWLPARDPGTARTRRLSLMGTMSLISHASTRRRHLCPILDHNASAWIIKKKEQGAGGAICCALSQGSIQLSTSSYSLSAASPVKAFLRCPLWPPFRPPPQRRTPGHFWKRANRTFHPLPQPLCFVSQRRLSESVARVVVLLSRDSERVIDLKARSQDGTPATTMFGKLTVEKLTPTTQPGTES
jgi:hypothetical protein